MPTRTRPCRCLCDAFAPIHRRAPTHSPPRTRRAQVTGYMRLNRVTDSIHEKFLLYFGACVALYPAGRLLTLVERFAPLWLGGHIVGFSSFFAWTLYTESDLLKSDAMLDGPPPTRSRTVVVWEAPSTQHPAAEGEVLGPQLPSSPK